MGPYSGAVLGRTNLFVRKRENAISDLCTFFAQFIWVPQKSHLMGVWWNTSGDHTPIIEAKCMIRLARNQSDGLMTV